MSRRLGPAGLAVAATVVALLAGGCGAVPSKGHSVPRPAPSAALPGLATSTVTAGGSWAVALLGGSAAAHNNFWQLFARQAGSSAWRLVTPPGVASNGGLVAASLGNRSLIAGFGPSQGLVFSPLASTGDDGASWSGGVLDARLADVPDALAAAPAAGTGSGRLLALLAGGQIDQASRGAGNWSRLSSLRSLAASPAGRQCAVTRLTAVAFTPSGTPLAAGTCRRPGGSGIFAYTAGAWRSAGPMPPAATAGHPLQVLRLTTTPAGEVALLGDASPGSPVDLVAGWSRDGVHWTVSAPLTGANVTVRSAGFSATGAAWVLMANGKADMITSAGSSWHALPTPPPHTTLLAFGSATTSTTSSPTGTASTTSASSATSHTGNSGSDLGVEALATFGSKLTVWGLGSAGTWQRVQAINVPIQYGTSG